MNLSFDFPNYKIIKKIGEGSYGSVYYAIHLITKREVAMKVFSKQVIMSDPKKLSQLRVELSIMKQAKHPILISLYEVVENNYYIAVVMEYVQNTLLEYVNLTCDVPPKLISLFFQQIISAIDYLHNNLKIVHRDLKVDNILLDKNFNIRIIDFGLSKFYTHNDIFSTKCGSIAYAAPELFTSNSYTDAVDIWSAGIVLYAISHDSLPFMSKNDAEIPTLIQNSEPVYDQNLDPFLIDLIQQMLKKDPKERITIQGIKEHPFFRKCEASYFIYNDPKFIIGVPLDEDVLKQIQEQGINLDLNQLKNSIMNDIYDSKAAIYRIFKKRKIVEELQSYTNPRRYPMKKSVQNTKSLQAAPNFELLFDKQDEEKNSSSYPNKKLPSFPHLIPESPALAGKKRSSSIINTVLNQNHPNINISSQLKTSFGSPQPPRQPILIRRRYRTTSAGPNSQESKQILPMLYS